MARPPSISVIIPAYNANHTIRRALASALEQTLPPAEIIVVDNASADNTAQIVEGFVGASAVPVRLLREERRGAAHARNAGAAAAQGEWLAFLDADDEWLPGKLRRCFSLMEPGTRLMAHDFLVDGGLVVKCHAARQREASAFAALYRGNFISTSTAVMRRDLFMDCGGFPTAYRIAEDYALWLEAAHRAGGAVQVLSDALARRHATLGSLTTNRARLVLDTLRVVVRYAPLVRHHASNWPWMVMRRLATAAFPAMTYLPRKPFKAVGSLERRRG